MYANILNMFLKSKRKINQNTLKILSTLAISLIVTMVAFLLNNIAMKNARKIAQKTYHENCEMILQGYSVGIHHYLDNYRTSLESIYYPQLFANGSAEEIQKWIIQNIQYLSDDFCHVFYVDSNYQGYFSTGEVVDLRDESYLSPSNFKDTDYYVSDMQYFSMADYPVFFIEKPCYNSEREFNGYLCASLKISVLSKIDNEIRIGEKAVPVIIDRAGLILTHPDENYIGKIYIPASKKYRKITSDVTAREGRGYVETENHLGEPIDLFYTVIDNCGWILAVGFKKEYLSAIYTKVDIIKYLILLVTIGALVLLLFCETFISNYFYRNQLIEPIYDPLTKLWSRQKFESEAAKIIRRNPKSKFMLIDTDIRGFKFINQNYTEDEADKLIAFYARLLNDIVQEYKGIIGRGYADHFYILVKIRNVREAMNIFKGTTYLLNEMIKAYEIPFFPKFGITFCKPSYHPEISIKELIGQAAFAKSTIKDNMLSPYSIYNARVLSKINEERKFEQCMKSSIENQDFFVMYQPKILLENETIVGAEALVRWKHPELGMIYPDKFIPLFERNGFIVKLDFYVYDKVFRFLDSQIKAGKPVVPISVNMSRNHNKPESFMMEFMRIFRRYAIPPYLVQVEIIERSVMNRETLCEITNALHKEGFTVAMDDFGSGESSLNMLTKVPVDVLKFDREFLLSSMCENGEVEEKSANFIRTLVKLGKNLDKETVFEGVETQKQCDFLRSVNCDQVQGYFYSKPLMEEDFVNFIASNIKENEK